MDEWLVQATEEFCPSCGERYLEYMDVVGDQLIYGPCCEAGREAVEDSGFFETLTHRQRKELISWTLGIACREVWPQFEHWSVLWPLRIVEVPQKVAFERITDHHRHHPPPPGWKFGFGIESGQELVGVCVVGRPVSRKLQERGDTLEVTRTCTWSYPQSRHAISKMLAEAAVRARRLGYRCLITYTLAEEPGVSLVAAGWRCIGTSPGGSWNRSGRPRKDRAPTGPKQVWEKQLRPRGHRSLPMEVNQS